MLHQGMEWEGLGKLLGLNTAVHSLRLGGSVEPTPAES